MLGIQLTLGGYEDEFAARIALLREKGDPLEFADLAGPPIPDEQNAAKLWEAAAAWLKANTVEGGVTLHDLGEDERAEREEKDWRPYLESLEPYYELLKRIPTRPGWSLPHPDPDKPGSHPHTWWLIDAELYLRYRVQLDTKAEGRTERAAEATILALDLVDRWQEPMAFGYYVNLSMKSSVARFVCSIHTKPGFDAHLYRKLVEARLAAALPESGPPARALRQMRIRGLWMVRKWLRGDLVNTHRPGLMERLRTTWVGRPWVFRDAVRYLDVIDAVIARCDKTPEEAVRMARTLVQETDYDPESLAGGFQRFIPNLFNNYAGAAATNRCARVAMALLEHKQKSGEWPEKLPAALPTNPFTGGPFEYERDGDGIRIVIPEIQDEWLLGGAS
ncbi:MAG: hypothetical protein ACYTF8_04390 [Planctomycetota bacterium]|jgi:hypothetical protein